MIDLDRFKELNDTLGHQAGDRALKEVALRLRICLRAADTPARIGGDEFAALLSDTDERGAVHVAERVARAMRESISTADASPALGASIGVAMYPQHGRELEELMAAADIAMYRAKANGGGYAIADPAKEAPQPKVLRRSRHRIARRVAIGLAATLAVLAGAMNPAGHKREQPFDAARRLHAAATVLETASTNVDVGAAVAGAEDTLAHIEFGDVATRYVASALERLERSLHEIRPGVVGALGQRVETLIASIIQAEAVADVPDVKKAPPKVRPSERPAPAKSETSLQPEPSKAASVSPEASLP
jgi:diguanylate cyclase (GGDEF)-like protein